MKFLEKIIITMLVFSTSAGAFSADITPVKTKIYELPKEINGEGNIKTKIEPNGYSLSDTNKEFLYNIAQDYEIAILSKRNSLVYVSKKKDFNEDKAFFKMLTIFSKLDSTEVTEGMPAEVFNQPEPVFATMNFSGNCKSKTLDINSSEYYDKNNKLIDGLSTQVPQTGIQTQESSLDGQILKFVCEEAQKKQKETGKKTSERELEVKAQTQAPTPADIKK